MPPDRQPRPTRAALAIAVVAGLAAAACLASGPRVNLTPHWLRGESLLYRIEISVATTGKTTTPMTNDEGATESSLHITLQERLRVESVAPSPAGDIVGIALIWEQAHATASSDAVDPTAADPAGPFLKLEGQSVEFTLSPDGGLANFGGLEKVFPRGVPPPESVAWIASLVGANRFPRGGLHIGQQWTSAAAIAGAPLAGLYWETRSTYQHNEPCRRMGESPSLTARQCAVVLGEMSIARHGPAHGDATPDDYLHNGLRTSGSWTGAGDELARIGLGDGILESDTENSSQSMDYEIRSATSGSTIHYVARVETQTGITLLEQLGPAETGKP